ncbi:sialidase family protein [Actinocrispum sp. NPDC049592]|uniref:sialidase family protein n=1 Tax=Actinocrispum sp. NPDC049592 TaxID=3154835 RepID=UPI00341BD335
MRRFSLLIASVSALALAGSAANATHSSTRVSGPSPFAPGCSGAAPGTLYTNAEVQPHLSVDPRNPRHLVGAYQSDRWSTVASQGVVTATSLDGGWTWRRAVPKVSECSGNNAFKRATDAWTTVAPDGTAYLVTLSMTGATFEPGSVNGVMVSRSDDGGLSWGDPVLLAQGDETVFNDLPTGTADPNDSRYVYALWTAVTLLDSPHFKGPTVLRRSTDGGQTWESPRVVHDPGVDAETTANRLVVLPDGTLVTVFARYQQSGAVVDLVVVRSTDKGVTWSAPSVISTQQWAGTKDPETGTPVRDGAQLPQAAVDGRGTLYVSWQDSRFTNGTHDSIVISRSTDAGRTWSTPVPVNKNLAVPAFFSALAAQRDGTVGVGYYDFRDNTSDPATLPTDYWLVTSRDNGVTWTERHIAGPFDLATAPKADRPVPSLYLGDYHSLVSTGRSFLAFFPMTTGIPGNPTDIFTGD